MSTSFGAAEFARERQARTVPGFDLGEMVRDLHAHEMVRGQNKDWLDKYAGITGGGTQNVGAPRVPIEALFTPRLRLDDLLSTRDMLASGVSGSSYLIGAGTQPVVEAVKPYSVVQQAGVELVIATNSGDQRFPTEASNATATWLATEGTSTITESQPTMGERSAVYHGLGVTLQVSRQLLMQTNSGEWLRRSMLRSIMRAVDAAVLAGTGTLGQPLGLANSSPVIAIDGAAIAAADINGAIKHVRDAGLDQRKLTWIAGPTAEEVLRNREAVSGAGRFLWEGNSILGMDAFATADAPTSSLFVGPWQDAKLVLWGDLQVRMDPFSDFGRGLSALRILVGVDVVFPQTGAFAYAPTVS